MCINSIGNCAAQIRYSLAGGGFNKFQMGNWNVGDFPMIQSNQWNAFQAGTLLVFQRSLWIVAHLTWLRRLAVWSSHSTWPFLRQGCALHCRRPYHAGPPFNNPIVCLVFATSFTRNGLLLHFDVVLSNLWSEIERVETQSSIQNSMQSDVD